MGNDSPPSSLWITKAIGDMKSLTVMLRPLSTYSIMIAIALLASKYSLSRSVASDNGTPYADDTKVFGFFLYFMTAIGVISSYSNKRVLIHPVLDYLLFAIPFLAIGPVVWSLTRMSFVEISYKVFVPVSLLPVILGPFVLWDEAQTLSKRIQTCIVQYLVFWIVMAYNISVILITLSLSRMANTGENTAIGMIRSACMFGIGFPIMKSLSMLLNRRGLTVFDVKEPTNSAEEVESKKTTFRFIASQEIYWNTLTRLLLAEIRDNTTFSISVVCSHIVVLMTRIISAAAFRRLQMEKKGKTAPVLSDAYNQFQKKRVSQFERDPRQLSVERTYLENLKEEVVLPGYGDHQSISTVPKEPHRDSTGSGSIFVNVPKIDVSPPNLHFTPMSDDIRFAFTNLTSMFAEWCGRISAFLITLLLTSTPPQYTWTQCLGPLPASTHFVRGCIMILFSLTMDAVGLVVEHRVSKATLRDAIEEFQTTEVSWLVYFQMMLMASSLSGAVIMAMPGILENGNECYKEGRNIWI